MSKRFDGIVCMARVLKKENTISLLEITGRDRIVYYSGGVTSFIDVPRECRVPFTKTTINAPWQENE